MYCKKVSRNTLNNINKILTLNKLLFTIFCVLAFGAIGIETVSYGGFLFHSIGVPSELFLFLGIGSCLVLFYGEFSRKNLISNQSLLFLNFVAITTPLILFVFYILSQLEANNYPNYVFSNYHVQMNKFQSLMYFSVFLTALHTFSSYLKFVLINKRKFLKLDFREITFFLLLLLFVISQSYVVGGYFIQKIANSIRELPLSYEQKRRMEFGEPYNLFSFINSVTPESSVIAVPAQNKWGIIGNIGFSRYFLYPRTLVHIDDLSDLEKLKVTHLIIARPEGVSTEVWPEATVSGKSILLYDEKIDKRFNFDELRVYDPYNSIFKDKWGVLEL